MAKKKSSDAQQQDVSPAEAPKKVEPEVFYRYQYLDGDMKEFKTKEDLDAGFRKSYLRQREIERERKKYEGEREEIEKKLADMQKEREHERAIARQYLEWDQMLQSNPQTYQQVKAILDGSVMNSTSGSQSSSNDDVSALREELNQLKEQIEQTQANSRVEAAWSALGGKYGDGIDRDAIEELLGRVESGDEEQLLDVLYHASRGYSSNGQADVSLAQTDQAKSAANLSSPGGVPSSPEPTYASAQEAADAAYKELVP